MTNPSDLLLEFFPQMLDVLVGLVRVPQALDYVSDAGEHLVLSRCWYTLSS